MTGLAKSKEDLLKQQLTPPNWEEWYTLEEEDQLDELVKRGLLRVVVLLHPDDHSRIGEFYEVTSLGRTALACAAAARGAA